MIYSDNRSPRIIYAHLSPSDVECPHARRQPGKGIKPMSASAFRESTETASAQFGSSERRVARFQPRRPADRGRVLDVNNFDAIRISLASAESIRDLVVRRGHQAGDDQLPHAQTGAWRSLLRAHLRSD